MSFFNKKKNGGFFDVIRCDEPSYLIWKWHPAGVASGANNRENSIRWGSSLRVKDGEVAVFVYKQKNGTMQDYIVGPFDKKLQTSNLPVLSGIFGLAFEGDTPFQAEVYFINISRVQQIRFAVPFFDVYDPRFSDFGVPVAVRGTISFSISDYSGFIKLHRLIDFDLDDFKKQISDAVSGCVKSTITNVPFKNSIPVVHLESRIAQINDVVEAELAERLEADFGVDVSGIDIGAIEIDKYSDGYRKLMSVTADISGAIVKAEAEAKIMDIADKQRIESEHYEETLRVQREEAQYAQHKQTQSANIGAFQIEKKAEVGIAGAEALGKMGENGAGGVELGGGTGFNPAVMMAGMAVGGAVGNNIASVMNGAMSGSGAFDAPPVPAVTYCVAKDGKPTGPFDIKKLTEMAALGELSAKSLVWKQGMSGWVSADSAEELKCLFPPEIPT